MMENRFASLVSAPPPPTPISPLYVLTYPFFTALIFPLDLLFYPPFPLACALIFNKTSICCICVYIYMLFVFLEDHLSLYFAVSSFLEMVHCNAISVCGYSYFMTALFTILAS